VKLDLPEASGDIVGQLSTNEERSCNVAHPLCTTRRPSGDIAQLRDDAADLPRNIER